MTKISIVIITLNEEKYLSRLLDSVEKQQYEDYEVIVSDAQSTDRTQEIARERDVKLVVGERKSPGHGRNHGAKEAEGDILLFLDADSRLRGKQVLKNIERSLNEKGNVVGTSTAVIEGDTVRGKIFFKAGNYYMRLVNNTGLGTMAPGSFQFIERNLFEEIGGYNEELTYFEDEDMVQRAKKHGNLVTLDKQYYMSSRRVDEKGIIKTMMDYYPPAVYRALGMDETVKNQSFETVGNTK